MHQLLWICDETEYSLWLSLWTRIVTTFFLLAQWKTTAIYTHWEEHFSMLSVQCLYLEWNGAWRFLCVHTGHLSFKKIIDLSPWNGLGRIGWECLSSYWITNVWLQTIFWLGFSSLILCLPYLIFLFFTQKHVSSWPEHSRTETRSDSCCFRFD